jgi:hypothetical protein
MKKTYKALNNEQQRIFNLLKEQTKKVQLGLSLDDQIEVLCLLEDQKLIEVTFFADDELCVVYNEQDSELHEEIVLANEEFTEDYLKSLFEVVVNATAVINLRKNQDRNAELRNYLKSKKILNFLDLSTNSN